MDKMKNRKICLFLSFVFIASCHNEKEIASSDNKFKMLLYKVILYERYPYEFGLIASYILINHGDNCLENVKDINKFNFLPDNIKFKSRPLEFCTKGTSNLNEKIYPKDTAFYVLKYVFSGRNLSNFNTVNKNLKQYLNTYEKSKIRVGNILFDVHPRVKIYHTSNFPFEEYNLPYHEKLEFSLPDKLPYDELRFKYDNFYNK